MRILLGVAVAVATYAAPAMPVAAAASRPTGVITIRAARSAHLQVTLPRPTKLWLQAVGEVHGPLIAGGGKHAGFLLIPAAKREMVGMVRLPSAPGTHIEVVAGGDVTPTVPAGRYTLRVVTDKAINVQVNVAGVASTTWTAKSPLTVRKVNATFGSDLGPEVVAAVPLRLTSTSAVLTVAMFRATGIGVSAVWCVSREPDCKGKAVEQKGAARPTVPYVDAELGATFVLPPRKLAAGPATATWTLRTDGLTREPTAFALVVG